ncbi:hypothetical protein HN011_005667 [Eciton burchellii]|nr:hypothetical protein HN011_005667 [Eciton burchellii]
MSEDRQAKESRKATSEVAPARRGGVFKNEVTADNIRKETNYLESSSRRMWLEKYEYLTGRFFNEVLAEECRETGFPVNTFARQDSTDDPPVVHSPIPLRPSPPVPRTTSAQIGHRSSRPEHNLEFTGRLYVSPKSTMKLPAVTAKLPCEMQQRFIFLG